MGLSVSSSGGSSVTYVTSSIACAASCTLTKHFCGTLIGNQGNTCIDINGVSTLSSTSTSYGHNMLCNLFFPSGTKICSKLGATAMFGCLIG